MNHTVNNWNPSLEYLRELVNKKLVIEKVDGNLSTFKYARKVVYENLWDTIPYMKEIRGIVYDNQTGELVTAAPRKTFNYLERGTWIDKPMNTPVTAYKKYNGFMACSSGYKGDLIVSTTGTTTSVYAKWAREEITKINHYGVFRDKLTDVYEIIVPQDPHIVKEEIGAVWLGLRNKTTGTFYPIGKNIVGTLGGILELAKTVQHEGFMVYDSEGNCCKIKSPYYIGKKKLMRMTDKVVDIMYRDPDTIKDTMHVMWHHVIDYIVSDHPQGVWSDYTEQSRREIIERVLIE